MIERALAQRMTTASDAPPNRYRRLSERALDHAPSPSRPRLRRSSSSTEERKQFVACRCAITPGKIVPELKTKLADATDGADNAGNDVGDVVVAPGAWSMLSRPPRAVRRSRLAS